MTDEQHAQGTRAGASVGHPRRSIYDEGFTRHRQDTDMRHLTLKSFAFLALCAAAVAAGRAQTPAPAAAPQKGTERHLRNIRQLTHGGENAEAYFSHDGTRLIYQSTRPEYPCDQIYTMKIDGSDMRRVSTGTGRTTCGYIYPAGDEILFASTHEAGAACPPRPSFERGYVWPIYDSYDIYRANADGSKLHPLTTTAGY